MNRLSELQQRLAHFRAMLAAAKTVTDAQMDAIAWVVVGTIPGMEGHWTVAAVVRELQQRVDILEAEVAREKAVVHAYHTCPAIVERN